MSVRPTPLWDEVAVLDEAVGRARGRLAELEAERSQAPRELAAARGELAAYDEAVGAGEQKPDAALEARLEARVRELEAVLRQGTIGGGATVELDARAESRAAGGRRAVEVARLELVDFLRRNAPGLFAELTPEAQAAQAALEAAVPLLRAADDRDQAVRRRARRVMDAAGIPAADLPASAFRGWADDVGVDGIPLPLPRSVLPELEEAAGEPAAA